MGQNYENVSGVVEMADFKLNVRLTLIQLMIFEPEQQYWIAELKAILTRLRG